MEWEWEDIDNEWSIAMALYETFWPSFAHGKTEMDIMIFADEDEDEMRWCIDVM